MTIESDETKVAVLVEKVGTMNLTLTKLDSKFDVLADKFASKEQVINLENRILSLEQWRIWIIGIATGLAVVASFVKDLVLGVHK